ncbi:hypothetical protein MUN76_11365 [Leucobacter rhizosphaerae]|uniref:EcsC family protein n=1 Tax=Leucobacter rhizosphaerae TaxID=2932245 RepID=A0ABY4FTL6_9MICO|nr:hypothetical protein [Leucobacter rhizosphaerae]UOQ59644.1 hypothetical protein MUN76_11365 [Leucobacter rhizosphaerae]
MPEDPRTVPVPAPEPVPDLAQTAPAAAPAPVAIPTILTTSTPPAPADPALPWLDRAVDRVLSIQRPIVVAHLRRVAAKHRTATPVALTRALETRYIAAVTAGGSAVGATAAVPAVGTVAALALASAETVGFLEATALYAHSLAEVHGITLENPDRARAIILTLLLGDEGLTLLRQVTSQAKGGASRSTFWGEFVGSVLPRQMLAPLVDQLKGMFLRKVATTGSASVIGKAIPYGVGAVIGGVGNYVLARRVVARSRTAFGPPPLVLPAELTAPRVTAIEAGEPSPSELANPAGQPDQPDRPTRRRIFRRTSRATRS